MTRLDAAWVLSEHELVVFSNLAADETSRGGVAVEPKRAAWDLVIEQKLRNWSSDPVQLADEDVVAPSPTSIAQAARIARTMRDRNSEPPTAVVPNSEGGIVFECARGPIFEAIEIDADGSAEYRLLEDCQLIRRQALA